MSSWSMDLAKSETGCSEVKTMTPPLTGEQSSPSLNQTDSNHSMEESDNDDIKEDEYHVQETPITKFRRDALSAHHPKMTTVPDDAQPLPEVGDEISRLRPSYSADQGDDTCTDNQRTFSTVSEPNMSSSSRLSGDRLEQILIAAMRYDRDDAATVPQHQIPRNMERQKRSDVMDATSDSVDRKPNSSLVQGMEATTSFSRSNHEDDEDERTKEYQDDSHSSLDQDETISNEKRLRSDDAGNDAVRSPRSQQAATSYEADTPLKSNRCHVEEASLQPQHSIQFPEEEDTIHDFTSLRYKPLLLPPVRGNENEGMDDDGISQSPTHVEGPSLPFRETGVSFPPHEDESKHTPLELAISMSYSLTTESDVGSIEGLPSNLQLSFANPKSRDEILQKLDGVDDTMIIQKNSTSDKEILTQNLDLKESRTKPERQPQESPDKVNVVIESPTQPQEPSFFDSIGLSFLWNRSKTTESPDKREEQQSRNGYWDEKVDEAFDALGHCAAIVPQKNGSNAIQFPSPHRTGPSFAESIRSTETDTKLHNWINIYYEMKEALPDNGTFDLGKSRTVIVHEIVRGNWTWSTAWSPEGDRLAMATENHHLAIVETTESSVWRVRHDRRLKGPAKGDTTHSIRSLSWGQNFIAAGGTGNAVSIIASHEPYQLCHVITKIGFVGSLDWKNGSNLLAIGSRSNKMTVVQVTWDEGEKQVDSHVVFVAEHSNWVNRVAFSPDGSFLACGDAEGVLKIYDVVEDGTVDISLNNEITLNDSILSIEWSTDGRWLYVGGEDYHISIVETRYWELIHKVARERWVQCIASSSEGSHVAVGGVDSEISILDVSEGWDRVMSIELKGVVPLSAAWHPNDQALAVTGQNNSVLVLETSNARHIKGHHLQSTSPVMAVGFAPDGRIAIVGNEDGIVTFFSLSKSSFQVSYELVVVLNDRLSIDWSPDGHFSAIGSKDAIVIVQSNKAGNNGRRLKSPFGYSVQRVLRDIGITNCVSIDSNSRYMAVAGDRTRIFDSTRGFLQVKHWKTGSTFAVAWSPDSNWLATIGSSKTLTIFDTSNETVAKWSSIFSLKCDFVGNALAFGPAIVGGLLYLAYGGSNKCIYIMEIRTLEGTWETVLRIPREGKIKVLDWGMNGLLAAGIDNGTVSILDLSYLQSGIAVNEKDYNWQRQALTSFTEVRRNRGMNSIQAVKWIPTTAGSESLLAVGGTDGEVEIVDLTERRRCRGYARTMG